MSLFNAMLPILIGVHFGIEPQLSTAEYTLASLSYSASIKQIYSTSVTTNIALTSGDNSEKIHYVSSQLNWGLSEYQIKRLAHGDKIQISTKIVDKITKKAGDKVRYLASNIRSKKIIKQGLFWFVAHPGNSRLSSNKSGTLEVAQNSKSTKSSRLIIETPSYQPVNLLTQSSSNSIVIFCYTFKGRICQVTLDINHTIRYI